MKYRPEIDVLRAFSVLGVIVFHLFPHHIPGGFLGVDVFFVISGFLITSIIQKQIKNNSFSFKAFWARRVKRLYPALITVLITTLVVCYFYYLPDNFQELGTHTLSAIFGIGNISLYNSSIGYFSKDAESFTLLHTWSLGVEEQFYFLYVITFYIFFKFTPKYKDILILVLRVLL